MSGLPWGNLIVRPLLIVLLCGAAIGATVMFSMNADKREYFRIENARLIPSAKADAHLACKVDPNDWHQLTCSDLRDFRLGQWMEVTLSEAPPLTTAPAPATQPDTPAK